MVAVKPLGDLCQITLGQSPSSTSYNQNEEGLPFFQGNADFGVDHPIARTWCTEPKKIAQPGDLLISVRAPIGAINVADCECCIGRGVASLRVKNDVLDMNYLRQCLTAKSDDLAALGTGSTFTAVGKAVLNSFEIPVYEIEEQREIAQRFGEIIRLRRYAEQMLAKADELIQSRFVEMFENSKVRHVAIKDICLAIVDCPHSTPKYRGTNKVFPAIRTSELSNGSIIWDSMKYVDEQEYLLRVKRLVPEAGDIVYAREGTYGEAAVLPAGYRFCLGQRVMLFRPDPKLCTSEYLLHAILSDSVRRQADSLNMGSTVPHVNVRDAMQFDIPAPPLALQNEFAEFVTSVESLKSTTRQQLDYLNTLYASLTQRYFA